MSTNYIKVKEDGTTISTIDKPVYGEISTSGDYYINGLWYDKTGTEYTEQFTYLSKDGKLLEVEVADNQPVDIHYNELAPTLVEDTIFATDVKTNTLTLAETKWINEDGVEYFDEGLLGVPDTTFSSTGARIYPDGTIRGKSSYGEYVRYPYGRLECTGKGRTLNSGQLTIFFPFEFSNSTYRIVGNSDTSASSSSFVLKFSSLTTSAVDVCIATSADVFDDQNFNYIAVGEWK